MDRGDGALGEGDGKADDVRGRSVDAVSTHRLNRESRSANQETSQIDEMTRFAYDASAARAGIRSVGVLCGGVGAAELLDSGARAVYDDPVALLAALDDVL